MVAVLLIPVVLILVVCLLERFERRVVAEPVGAPKQTARPAAVEGPMAAVVPLRSGPDLETATLRLRRAS